VRSKNQIHFEHETLHVRVWMHWYYLEHVYGVYTPRLGGWA
jgi:hypothetical protein